MHFYNICAEVLDCGLWRCASHELAAYLLLLFFKESLLRKNRRTVICFNVYISMTLINHSRYL